MFTGTYIQKLDNKGRVVIPIDYRDMLHDCFFITRSLDGCLSIYEKESWEKFEEELSKLPYTDERARLLKRFTLGSSVKVEIDKQGRILIPQILREAAKLNDDIVFVGVSERIEVWDKESFDKNNNFFDDEDIARKIEGLWKDTGLNV